MDKKFLEGLGKKLKGIANLKSIYLNCLPGNSAQKLDINDLNNKDIVENNNFVHEFFNNLLSKPDFKCELTLSPKYLGITKKQKDELEVLKSKDLKAYDEKQKEVEKQNEKIKQSYSKLKKRLITICSNQEDNISEYGVGVFGFGYPILIKKRENDGKMIKAPLVIWNLQIKQTNKKKDTWIIEREEDNPIYLNQPLIASLEQENLKLNSISEDILDDGVVDERKT